MITVTCFRSLNRCTIDPAASDQPINLLVNRACGLLSSNCRGKTMDAAYNSLKKTVLFVATALLLAAPIYATAPAIVINPGLTGNTVQISNTSCDQQTLNLTSTGGQIGITVSVSYKAGDQNGQWLGAISGTQTTYPTGNSFNAVIPDITSPTGPAGISLEILLERNFSSPTEQGFVTLTVNDSSGAASVPITVDYTYNSSCGGNVGPINNGYITIQPGTLTMTAAQGRSQNPQLEILNETESGRQVRDH